jgi:hypothetical protein
MKTSITGYGNAYELKLSKAKAQKILGDFPLPRMGYETTVECVRDEQWSAFKHYLTIANISGTYVLNSVSVKNDKWEDVFNIKIK